MKIGAIVVVGVRGAFAALPMGAALKELLTEIVKTGTVWKAFQRHDPTEALAGSIRPPWGGAERLSSSVWVVS